MYKRQVLALSLSRNETKNGTSNLAINNNNGFGLDVYKRQILITENKMVTGFRELEWNKVIEEERK